MKVLASFLIVLTLLSCSKKDENIVTVYVSEDQVFSEPLLRDFEKETGIVVKAIYDSEESKGTGVMNRLIAEKKNPQADVYWANEPIRAEVLKSKDILEPYTSKNAKDIPSVFKEKNNYWTGFSARVRVFVADSNLKQKPSSILDYTNPIYRGKATIANPLFGTTTVHIAALFTLWGDEKTKEFMQKLKENQVTISSSNGESADFVASKNSEFALVDSDDAMSRLKNKKDITIIYPDQKDDEIGAFVVPNTLMLIKGAKHAKNGKILIDYLLSRESEKKLAFADCAQIPLHDGVKLPKGLKKISDIKVMQVDYEKVAKKLLEIEPFLKEW
jgi:iron(III) transport system substrate-binding protein